MKFSFKEIKEVKGVLGISTFIAGLCCVPSIILVLFGIGSLSAAISLNNNLFTNYVWVFRGAALLFMLGGLFYYLYKKENVCTFDEAKRQRNKIINLISLSTIVLIVAYYIWFYVILNYIGSRIDLW